MLFLHHATSDRRRLVHFHALTTVDQDGWEADDSTPASDLVDPPLLGHDRLINKRLFSRVSVWSCCTYVSFRHLT